MPPRDGKPITMRNIMTHTAGFEEQIKNIITEDPETADYVTLLKRWIPTRVFDAGTTPAYSNYATSLAGYVVERVSGEPFFDYIDKHIFAPLDMTAFVVPPAAAEGARAADVDGLRHGLGAGEEIRDGRPGAGRLGVLPGRGHGALHDRAPAERRVQGQPHPEGGDGQADARHAR